MTARPFGLCRVYLENGLVFLDLPLPADRGPPLRAGDYLEVPLTPDMARELAACLILAADGAEIEGPPPRPGGAS